MHTQARLSMVLLALLVGASLSACSANSLLGFRAPIPIVSQGNLVQKSRYTKLEKGMTPEQVIFLLGRPTLSTPFNLGEWHYVTNSQRGDEVLNRVHIRLVFDAAAQLDSWGFVSGDAANLQESIEREATLSSGDDEPTEEGDAEDTEDDTFEPEAPPQPIRL